MSLNFQIIISPAKKMNIEPDILPYRGMPCYLSKAEILAEYLQSLSYPELKKMWKCSDKIAQQNAERLKGMDLTQNLTPAILAYEGIQYKYMAPQVLEEQGLEYIEKNLRILSGFYGILRPFDGVIPYRLEMQTKFSNWEYGNLYEYWGADLAQELQKESNLILNLASKEYSKAVEKHLASDVEMIEVVFGEIIEGKVIEKGTLAKMARGEMVRFLAQHEINDVEKVTEFSGLGYIYREELSQKQKLVFIKEKQKNR